MYLGLVILLLSVTLLILPIMRSSYPSLLKFEFISVSLSFGAIMFASSYVEEEQQFWYWITTTHFAVAFLQRFSPLPSRAHASLRTKSIFSNTNSVALFMQLPLLTVIRRWNQTGQKFAGASDIVKLVLQPNPQFLAILVISTYLLAGYSVFQNTFREDEFFRRVLWPIILVGAAFIFKISLAAEAGEPLPIWLQHIPFSWSSSLITKARISFIALALGLIGYIIRWITLPQQQRRHWISGAFSLINIFLLGQSRYVNIPLFLLFELQRLLLESSNTDPQWLQLTSLWMQHVSFFSLGNSNSLSSIDLSNAYNGISSYSIPLVGLLTFISNWSGPIYWSLCSLHLSRLTGYVQWMCWCVWFHGVVMGFLVMACIMLRTHLFIWTVFSPKFLFQAVWMGLAQGVVQGVVGGIIVLIG